MNKEKNIYVGCGPDIREGFIHCDIRKFDHVDIVCKAWELSSFIMEVDHIYSRHMLEHLTDMEAQLTLENWFLSLKNKGSIRLIVPDMDFHCKQWLNAIWSDDTIKDKWSDAIHSHASIFGWQNECNPLEETYNTTYWDVHKSGYNKNKLTYLLKKIGYRNIFIETKNNWHLVATATK